MISTYLVNSRRNAATPAYADDFASRSKKARTGTAKQKEEMRSIESRITAMAFAVSS
jgi:hypothetical protein